MLRPAHLAYYKTSAEYKLLRLLNLTDVHSCTQVVLKKHVYTFGVVTFARTFYLEAESPEEVEGWVAAIQEARETVMMTWTQTSLTTAVGMSESRSTTPALHGQNITSSDSEDVSPSAQRTYSTGSQSGPMIGSSPTRGGGGGAREMMAKIVVSGYLMKCGSKRHNWRKRWFVLYGDKLVYSGSHMVGPIGERERRGDDLTGCWQDTKSHREFSVGDILDALEFDMGSHKHSGGIPPPVMSGPVTGLLKPYTFKVVTTKRTLLLCAPSEEEEIQWLSAVRALIARRTGAGVVRGESKVGVEAGQTATGRQHKGRNASVSGPSGGPIADG